MTLLASQITAKLATIAAGCVTASGYVSNVGAAVKVAELGGDYTQAPAVFILPGREAPADARYTHHRLVTRSYEVRGYADMYDHPTLADYELVDLVIWDLRKCIETYSSTLEALIERMAFVGTRPGYREGGGTIVGAALDYTVTYECKVTTPSTAG